MSGEMFSIYQRLDLSAKYRTIRPNLILVVGWFPPDLWLCVSDDSERMIDVSLARDKQKLAISEYTPHSASEKC